VDKHRFFLGTQHSHNTTNNCVHASTQAWTRGTKCHVHLI